MLFTENNSIQHVPSIWCQTQNMISKCWFPYTKSEFPQAKVYFSNKCVTKMIRES